MKTIHTTEKQYRSTNVRTPWAHPTPTNGQVVRISICRNVFFIHYPCMNLTLSHSTTVNVQPSTCICIYVIWHYIILDINCQFTVSSNNTTMRLPHTGLYDTVTHTCGYIGQPFRSYVPASTVFTTWFVKSRSNSPSHTRHHVDHRNTICLLFLFIHFVLSYDTNTYAIKFEWRILFYCCFVPFLKIRFVIVFA